MGAARRCRDIGRFVRRWTGATTFWPLLSVCCCSVWRCSRAVFRSRPPTPWLFAVRPRTAEIADGVANLVAKSLVTSDITGGAGYFRLLETTRVYALSKLTESGELQEFSRRHAEYYQGLLEAIENEWEKRSTPLACVDNVRAALEWCFGDNGDLAIGVALAAAVVPVFLAMSLLPECHRWSERRDTRSRRRHARGLQEMQLQASLGVSSMQMHGESEAARAALNRSLAIAEARGDVLNQVGLLGMLSMFEVRDGDFRTSLHYAQLSRAVDGTAENSAAMALANSILGRALQFVGEHDDSRLELEASFRYWSGSQQSERGLSRPGSPHSGRHRPGAEPVAARPSGPGHRTAYARPSRMPNARSIRRR